MSPFAGRRVAVFHAGALGDFILTWPLLRALRAVAAEVHVFAAPSHAALAAQELGIRGHSAEQPWITSLWREEGPALPAPAAPGADVVVSFLVDACSARERRWCDHARAALGAHTVIGVGPPGSPSRAECWEMVDAARLGAAPARTHSTGPALLHVGAGSRSKAWPMEHWQALADGLGARGRHPGLIAGHVEMERFSPAEQALFSELGGTFIGNLDMLATRIRSARLLIAADTGPAHLAAQLGIATIALFGPTDPDIWRPVGPWVEVVRSASGSMRDIPPLKVLAIAEACLAGRAREAGPPTG